MWRGCLLDKRRLFGSGRLLGHLWYKLTENIAIYSRGSSTQVNWEFFNWPGFIE